MSCCLSPKGLSLTFFDMTLKFHKYQGTGNDFIIIAENSDVRLSVEQIRFLCDRRFGVGSDGLIIIGQSETADFEMDFYNPDGSKSFCGNGSRCAVLYAVDNKLIHSDSGVFNAIDGRHEFLVNGNEVKIHMRDVSEIHQRNSDFILNTGSPHYIVNVNDTESIDLTTDARKIRYSEEFAGQGINVNFVQPFRKGIRMRTYERGVEDETLSCGTGVTAAALSFVFSKQMKGPLDVTTRGGKLSVEMKKTENGSFTDIWLCGPAMRVFFGEIEI